MHIAIIRAAGFSAHVGRMQTCPRYYMITIINVLYNIYYVCIDQYPTDPFDYEPRNNIVSLSILLGFLITH